MKTHLLSLLIAASLVSFSHGNPYGALIEKTFGDKNVSAELESYIRSVAQEMGISWNFKIKQINMNGIKTIGAENAFCYLGYLFVHEPFIDILHQEEKRFLIAHELSHIYFKHTELRMAFPIVNCFAILTTICAMYGLRNKKLAKGLIGCGYIGFRAGLHYWFKKKVHEQELEADAEAAKLCQSTVGAERFLQRMAKYNPTSMHASSHTHPAIITRLNALKDI